jgi:hypothetical protein
VVPYRHILPLAPACSNYLARQFNEACEAVLKHRDAKDRLVKRTVIVLLPALAHYHPEAFVRGYAEAALAHLLAALRDTSKTAPERGTVYVAIGRIALAVRRSERLNHPVLITCFLVQIGGHIAADALRPSLERIMLAVKEGLTVNLRSVFHYFFSISLVSCSLPLLRRAEGEVSLPHFLLMVFSVL